MTVLFSETKINYGNATQITLDSICMNFQITKYLNSILFWDFIIFHLKYKSKHSNLFKCTPIEQSLKVLVEE